MAQNLKYSRRVSFLIVIAAYILCLICGYISLVAGSGHLAKMWNMLLADIVATIIIWIFSLILRNASMYDAYWSVIPIAVTLYWICESDQGWELKNVITFAVVCYWGIRLTVNWARGWTGLQHEDWRYAMLHDKNPKLYWLTNLGGIHLFPTIVVFLCMMPICFLVSMPSSQFAFIIGGSLISVAATTIEFVADEQMKAFKKRAKPNEYIDKGLWRYSRHPNYFGEIMFWVGLFVMSLGVAEGHFWIGAVVLILMFRYASIPMMEERTLKSKPHYADQIRRVNMLLPWFRRQG